MKVVWAFFALLPPLALAFVPDLGHLVRHQPMMLRSNPQPFTVDGVFEIDGDKAPFKITWGGVKSGYTVEFKKLPSAWTESSISELVLFRDGSACQLTLNKAPYPCSALRFWGDFEFNPSADRVLQTVSSVGVAPASDMIFRAINSKDFDAKRIGKVKPVLKTIQGTYLSVLEYTNGNNSLAFDSLNYSPLAARFAVDGMLWEFTGSPQLYLEKEENKNNLIISRRIEVKEGEKLLAIIKRDPFKRATKPALAAVSSSRGSVSDVPYDRFTSKGKNFLKILFLTH